jgi:enoyl-CoA hydratase/carnithine racemase
LFSSEIQRVETTIDENGICHVVLNRPDNLNGMDLPMFEAVAETASNLRQNKNIRAVILSGRGRAFCTGLDVVGPISQHKSAHHTHLTDIMTNSFFITSIM